MTEAASLLYNATDRLMQLKAGSNLSSLSKAEGLQAHYAAIYTLIYAIAGSFRQYAMNDWSQLLLSMNALEMNMKLFVRAYNNFYLQNYSLYDHCGCEDHCSTLNSLCCLCFFWSICSKKIHTDAAIDTMDLPLLFNDYNSIVEYYRVVAYDNNLESIEDIVKELKDTLRAPTQQATPTATTITTTTTAPTPTTSTPKRRVAPVLSQYKNAARDFQNELNNVYYPLFDEIEDQIQATHVFEYTSNNNIKSKDISGTIEAKAKLSALCETNFHVLRLIEIQDNILNYRRQKLNNDDVSTSWENEETKEILCCSFSNQIGSGMFEHVDIPRVRARYKAMKNLFRAWPSGNSTREIRIIYTKK